MSTEFRPEEPRRFEAAIRRFDEENSRDPNTEIVNGVPRQRELIYAQWLTDWVLRLSPDASEELRLAARCQHLCRWSIARGSYPMSRAGYLKWRADLKIFHAEKAGEILREVGYPPEIISKVQVLNLKRNFPKDPECRVLEDALCLIFLERQLGALMRKSTEDKVINALQKSWKKMTEQARAEALKLPYTPEEKALIERALNSSAPVSESDMD
ncbi:MAG TPA: DUF4202 domain-containing protein [Verrucomicrobiae bacterium]|nr:DUF4202 domain-containing protein [Verrucomicrobiae bacterium]